MKIALVGATGYVGQHVLQEALARGHHVTAVARNPDSLPDHSHLNKSKHDFLVDPRATGKLLSDYHLIIYAFNPKRGSTDADIFEQHIRGHRAFLAAMAYSNVKRVLCVGGAASLKLASGVEFLDSDQFPAQFNEFKPGIRGTRELYYLLREHPELDWVFLAPSAVLVDGERTGSYRTGTDYLLFNEAGVSTISLQDYAVAMLDEAENPQHHRERFTVGY
jgi:putative NADH-flavin reductase